MSEATKPAPGDAPLRLASWNVHRWIGRDGRRDVERAERVLRELAADVVALQEVDCRTRTARGCPPVEELAERLGYRLERGPTLHHADGTYGNALLSRLPFRRIDLLDLTVPGREPRCALDVELAGPNAPLRVVAAHLGLQMRERRFQVQRLVAAVDGAGPPLVVVCGDMNEWVRGFGALLPLHRRFGRTAGLRTFPSGRPLFPLDRIWVAPAERVRRLWVHRTAVSRDASDHLPICAEIACGAVRAAEAAAASGRL